VSTSPDDQRLTGDQALLGAIGRYIDAHMVDFTATVVPLIREERQEPTPMPRTPVPVITISQTLQRLAHARREFAQDLDNAHRAVEIALRQMDTANALDAPAVIDFERVESAQQRFTSSFRGFTGELARAMAIHVPRETSNPGGLTDGS